MEKLSPTKKQHFVPQHYLRQFRCEDSDHVLAAKVDPYHFIGRATIRGQCQSDYFYGDDGRLENFLSEAESHIAPVLLEVCAKERYGEKEIGTLGLLASLLHVRTRKAAEASKLFPKKIAYEVIKNGIERGEIPAPSGGWEPGMMDFTGVQGMLLQRSLEIWFEMSNLQCRILRAPIGSAFVTSDCPVVILNQFAEGKDPVRCFIGFAQSGFQLFLPISPRLCLYFYDPRVYRVGNTTRQSFTISAVDVNSLNSLQAQSAEHCVYCSDTFSEPQFQQLVTASASLRKPLSDGLKIFPGRSDKEEFLLMQPPRLKVPTSLTFNSYWQPMTARVGTRRDPLWSEVMDRLMKDLHKNPGGDVFQRLNSIVETLGR